MPEFFLELFSEEIPARMQAEAASRLARLAAMVLADLRPVGEAVSFAGPRRIALAMAVGAATPEEIVETRGPRVSAPEKAVEGFLRKNGASREEVVVEGDHHVLRRRVASRSAAEVIGSRLPEALAGFSWPKSMRWGQSGAFTWVRPLRRVTCLLDGAVVPMALGPVAAGDRSEGHRFHAPGDFAVESAAQWEAELQRRFVIASAETRRVAIATGLDDACAALGLSVVPDNGLLDEVTGLVEWPVVLVGRIEAGQMRLPPEVRELSMKVNQRYFATRDAAGAPAPCFAFVANIQAEDGGAAIIAGNERVLRARLGDAEHFWATDRRQGLDVWLPKLGTVVFHEKIGTQLERAQRLAVLAREIAEALGADDEIARVAERAGLLCKADLVSGMVGEFPELQGIMGGYYADDPGVGAAIRTHYQPKGPSDAVPEGMAASAVALADKIDLLREFFRIGERPSGSGDPYALRRAALGVIRVVLENGLRLGLRQFVDASVFEFLVERLRVMLRGDGRRYDVLNAVFGAAADDDLVRLIARTAALEALLGTEDGGNLVAAYRRAVNILRIEDERDGPHEGAVVEARLSETAERDLALALDRSEALIETTLAREDFTAAMIGLAELRLPVDAFFDHVTVNAAEPELRRNRLRLLARLRDVMHRVADFSKLEG